MVKSNYLSLLAALLESLDIELKPVHQTSQSQQALTLNPKIMNRTLISKP